MNRRMLAIVGGVLALIASALTILDVVLKQEPTATSLSQTQSAAPQSENTQTAEAAKSINNIGNNNTIVVQ